MLQLYSNVIESYNVMHVHYLWLFGSQVIRVVASFQTISTTQTGREDPQCSSDVCQVVFIYITRRYNASIFMHFIKHSYGTPSKAVIGHDA